MASFAHTGRKLYTDINYNGIYDGVVERYQKDTHLLDYTWYMNYTQDIVKDYVANNNELSVSIVDDYGYMNAVIDYENDGMVDVYFFDEENVSKEALAVYLINRVFVNAYAIMLEMIADDEDALSDDDTILMDSDGEDF